MSSQRLRSCGSGVGCALPTRIPDPEQRANRGNQCNRRRGVELDVLTDGWFSQGNRRKRWPTPQPPCWRTGSEVEVNTPQPCSLIARNSLSDLRRRIDALRGLFDVPALKREIEELDELSAAPKILGQSRRRKC